MEGFVGVSVEGLGEEGMPQGSEPTTVYKVWVGNIPTHVVHSNQVFEVSGKDVQTHISHVVGLSYLTKVFLHGSRPCTYTFLSCHVW